MSFGDERELEQGMWAGAWSLACGFGPGRQVRSNDQEGSERRFLGFPLMSSRKDLKYYFI